MNFLANPTCSTTLTNIYKYSARKVGYKFTKQHNPAVCLHLFVCYMFLFLNYYFFGYDFVLKAAK